MQLKQVTPEDAQELAVYNRELIQEEGHRNPMNLRELTQRMESFLMDEWEAVYFIHDGQKVGYALYKFGTDAFDSRIQTVYLRQFLILYPFRKQGLGRKAFETLKQEVFKEARIHVEVLTHNERGVAFWKAMGFKMYSMHLHT
ncbi:GNAT family N-acetyltransferase [Deinococcus cellulosilyticus]|uniref:N-acetyltransferase domain-containing protein n=1 Tax=Deinococcus cellulosilyticus (strain DSM 18568 / NBRC 106333 / KACC 11606 / 5516J-15) TaxID=1223518 RepID=A0A511N8R8_DEIC1|nr:GNAT family N-acetyltransferase [Deinococcus cellulosilyticus]GEM49220.1 hypothetical protein DC3_48550 [Deinococcus cellulosilyticus NBRC 106333 = KACC 11606]